MVYSVYYVPSEDRTLQAAQHQKKAPASVAWVGGSTCVQGAVPRQLPKTGLDPFGHGPATIQSFKAQLNTRNVHRMSQLVLFWKGYMVWSIERQVVKPCLKSKHA